MLITISNRNADPSDIIKALQSLEEEIEAVKLYEDRLADLTDPQLQSLMQHNLEEEAEHAAMLIEWLRTNMEAFREKIREKLGNPNYLQDGSTTYGIKPQA